VGTDHRLARISDVRSVPRAPRSTAQVADLTTLIVPSDDSRQLPEFFDTEPFAKLSAVRSENRPAALYTAIRAQPAAGPEVRYRPTLLHHAPRVTEGPHPIRQPSRGRHRRISTKTISRESSAHRTSRDQQDGNLPRSSTAQRQRIYTVAAMNYQQRKQYWTFVGLWLIFSVYFWEWWASPSHVGSLALFVTLSIAWFYSTTLLPTFYLFYLGCMRRPIPMTARRAEELGLIGRVAVVTLTVPGSESLEIVRRQLEAMKAIRYPHDSWILVDKEHSAEIKCLARQLGVFYFSRHDTAAWGPASVARWNAATPPFKSKTKAGNVNSWLEIYSHRYTQFTQLDIDHHPAPDYLESVLGYFVDPAVAWVQAPSVYGNHQYWTARGSSEQEVVLQGPLQMGFFGFSRTPFIIGSHCTYDMKAICSIGGFQPTRAEDHLDTVCLAAKGHEGVYVPEVIATGDGPENFEIYLAQQFAWAFSMIQVLFKYTPRLIRRYTPRQALQFIFVQTWYTFWSLSMLIIFVAPLVSLVFNKPISTVSLWAFLQHSIPAGLIAAAVWWWSRSWQQPRQVALSWRGIALHMARWVIVLSAFAQVILGVKKPYMITAKGIGRGEQRPIRLAPLIPYIGLILVPLVACWLYMVIYQTGSCQGYMFFGIEEATLFWLLLVLILIQDMLTLKRAKVAIGKRFWLYSAPVLTTMLVTMLLIATAFASYGRILQAWSKGVTWPSL
jgi:cellulose synthase (UDP-forming)